jgi:proline dehydrogenase
LEWCQARNSQGIRCIIDVLGEYATTKEEADSAKAAYKECIDQICQRKLNASISIKLSALGGMFEADLSEKNAMELAKEAFRKEVGFEIDMEGKQSVDLTIRVTKACAAAGVPVTMALQAYLKRTLDDLDEMSRLDNIRFRLVKGAYRGDTADNHMISESYKLLTQALAFLGRPYCVATHDPEILDWMKSSGVVDPCKVEFGFLKGLADMTKMAFGKNNLSVSEYVPFGKESGPYIARRMKYLRDLEEQGRNPAP